MASKEPTPGPWEWVGSSLEGPKGETVLEVRDLPERAYPEMQSGALVMDNEVGDKPLLAAARDMYEALEALLPALQRYFDDYGAEHEDGCPEDDTCICPKVQALNSSWTKAYYAMNKARGEE